MNSPRDEGRRLARSETGGPRQATSAGHGGGPGHRTRTELLGRVVEGVFTLVAVGLACLIAALLFFGDDWFVSQVEKSAPPGDRPASLTSPPPSREPDPYYRAFAAVSVGDCLALNDGSGNWDEGAPRKVPCAGAESALRVTRTLTEGQAACPAGAGLGTWLYLGDPHRIELCLRRQLEVGECFLAASQGGSSVIADLMTSWGCGADRIPRRYDYILRVTAYFDASYGSDRCPSSGRPYFAFKADGGQSLVCAENALNSR